MYISRLNFQGVGYSTGIVRSSPVAQISKRRKTREIAIRSVESSVIQSGLVSEIF